MIDAEGRGYDHDPYRTDETEFYFKTRYHTGTTGALLVCYLHVTYVKKQ